MDYTPPSSPRPNFPAQPPERSTPPGSAPGVPEYVRQASVNVEQARGVTLIGTTQTGQTVAILVYFAAPGIVRVLLHGDVLEPQRRKLARELAPQDMTVLLEKSADRVTLRSELLSVAIDLTPFQITFAAPDGQVLLEQNRGTPNVTDGSATPLFGFSASAGQPVACHDSFTVEPDEHFYGLGEKFTEFDKRGQQFAICYRDADSAHCAYAGQNVPFFVSSRGYGIFVDSTAGVNFDMAHGNQAAFSFVVTDSVLDYYVIAGPDLKSVLSRYASLVRFPMLPPKWAFGLWMAFGLQTDRPADVLYHAGQLRESGIPCDALELDCDGLHVDCWAEIAGEQALSPELAELIRELQALDFKVCPRRNSDLGIEGGGDANCTYPALAATLRAGLSLGLCGHAFWSHVIGGLHGQPTPELFVRWAQFGLFSPLSRASGTTLRRPWEYGAEALRIFSVYTRLRYRLWPYLYTYARLVAETGLPLIRPMVLEFPADPNTYTLDLQYMFGAEFLVAPIYNSSGHRPIYLPAGKWVDFYTHEVITGPQTRFVDAPLDVLPLYVRANALIPTIAPGNAAADAPFEFVIFDAYLLNRGSFVLRDTDGVTALAAAYEGTQLNLELAGEKKRCGVRVLPLADTPVIDHIQVNGARLNRLERLELEPQAQPGWTRAVDGTIIVALDFKAEES